MDYDKEKKAMQRDNLEVGWWRQDGNRSNLRKLLDEQAFVLMAGAWDAWSAKIVEETGVDAIGVTGLATAGARGWPDIGVIGAEDFAETVAAMRRVVEIPILCDVDTGFGGPVQVARTIRLIEEAGGSGVHIEDQENPKQTGVAAVPVVSTSIMEERIAAACAARVDADFMIIARCDSALSYGLDDAIGRCKRYLAAGADGTLLIFPKTIDELRTIGREVPGIKMTPLGPHSDSWRWSVAEIVTAGFTLIDASLYPLFYALEGMREFLLRYREEETAAFVQRQERFELNYLNELLGIERYHKLQAAAANGGNR